MDQSTETNDDYYKRETTALLLNISRFIGVGFLIYIGSTTFYQYYLEFFRPIGRLPSLPSQLGILVPLPCLIMAIGLIFKTRWSYYGSLILFIFLSLYASINLLANVGYGVNSNIQFYFLGVSLFYVFYFLLSKNVKAYFGVDHRKIFDKVNYILVGSILIFLSSEYALVKYYTYNKRMLIPSPKEINLPQHREWPFYVEGNIDNNDIKEIYDLVRDIKPYNFYVFQFTLLENDTIRVDTGEMLGSLSSDSYLYYFLKINNKWKLVDKNYLFS